MEENVSAVELRVHVERVLEQAEFADSPRHRQLLRYLADHAIATGGRSLSAEAIEADVLRRSAGGRGRATASAHVMVHDLRERLQRYAAAAGRGDAIRLSIPLNDCRLEATRRAQPTTRRRRPLPPGPRRLAILIVEFDAEPALRGTVTLLAKAIAERLMTYAAIAEVSSASRQQISDRGLAIEDAPAACDADAGVHGMLMALPGEHGLDASLGASARLIDADAVVVWTLWCEEPLADGGGDEAVRRLAGTIAAFVADTLRFDSPRA